MIIFLSLFLLVEDSICDHLPIIQFSGICKRLYTSYVTHNYCSSRTIHTLIALPIYISINFYFNRFHSKSTLKNMPRLLQQKDITPENKGKLSALLERNIPVPEIAETLDLSVSTTIFSQLYNLPLDINAA